MRAATTIRDLMRIRAYNREDIDSINGNMGTALGIKNTTGVRAIIIFVPQKIHPKWLPNGQLIKETLSIPGDIECPVDVVAAEGLFELKPTEYDEWELSDRLRGWDEKLWPGSIVSCWLDPSLNERSWGTLGVFARKKSGYREVGFITNQHVAVGPGKKIYHPVPWGKHIGITREIIDFVEAKDWYDPSVDEPDTFVRADCAFVELSAQVDIFGDINPQLIASFTTDQTGKRIWGGPTKLGEMREVRLDDSITSIIGTEVMRIGSTTAPRIGRIQFLY